MNLIGCFSMTTVITLITGKVGVAEVEVAVVTGEDHSEDEGEAETLCHGVEVSTK